MANHYLESLYKMAEALDTINADYIYRNANDGGQFVFNKENGVMDVAIHSGTYGSQFGLFESYGFPWDNGDVTGFLEVEDFIKRYQEVFGS